MGNFYHTIRVTLNVNFVLKSREKVIKIKNKLSKLLDFQECYDYVHNERRLLFLQFLLNLEVFLSTRKLNRYYQNIFFCCFFNFRIFIFTVFLRFLALNPINSRMESRCKLCRILVTKAKRLIDVIPIVIITGI